MFKAVAKIQIKDILYQNGDTRINTIQSNWMTIATQSDKFKTDLAKTMNMSNYLGCLDNFCIWIWALSKKDIMQIVEDGKKGQSAQVTETIINQ